MADTPAPAANEQADAKLSAKQRVFVEYYLKYFNGAKAARKAGYSEKTAHEQAARLLAKASIQNAIAQRVSEIAMSANEVLLLLTEQARGNMDDFLDAEGDIDIEKARRKKKMRLLKKIKTTVRTDKNGDTWKTTEIELHDAQAALVHLGRAHKLFVDRLVTTDEQLLVQMDF